jgi:serine/threonine-protein kinase
MAHRPTDRYATPKALAEDVERWMADEAVSAWREPVSRRLVRWLTRHRTGVTAAGAAVLVALAGTGAVLAVQTRANAELRHASAELQAANARVRDRFDLATEAIRLFNGEVSEDLLVKEKQFEALRAKLLKGAAGFYGKLEHQLEGQSDPGSRAALGAAYYELGELTRDIGNIAAGADVHRKGLAVRCELAGQPRANGDAAIDVVRSLLALGLALDNTGDNAGRDAAYDEALKLAAEMSAQGRRSDEARSVLAESLLVIGWACLPSTRHSRMPIPIGT